LSVAPAFLYADKVSDQDFAKKRDSAVYPPRIKDEWFLENSKEQYVNPGI
jgi:hypothetical protein